jgi:hypothetical protein
MKSIATFAVCKTLWLETMFPLTSPSIGLFRQTLIGDIKLSITVLEVLRSRLQHSALQDAAKPTGKSPPPETRYDIAD